MGKLGATMILDLVCCRACRGTGWLRVGVRRTCGTCEGMGLVLGVRP